MWRARSTYSRCSRRRKLLQRLRPGMKYAQMASTTPELLCTAEHPVGHPVNKPTSKATDTALFTNNSSPDTCIQGLDVCIDAQSSSRGRETGQVRVTCSKNMPQSISRKSLNGGSDSILRPTVMCSVEFEAFCIVLDINKTRHRSAAMAKQEPRSVCIGTYRWGNLTLSVPLPQQGYAALHYRC